MPVMKVAEEVRQVRMIHWLTGIIGDKVLLRDVGNVIALVVLREEMIKRLILGWPAFLRNGLIPFLRIRKHRVDIENDAAKWMLPMTDDLTQGVFRTRLEHNRNPLFFFLGIRGVCVDGFAEN